MQKARKYLSLHEGRIPHAYQDSLGYWTIGVGHLIDKRRGGGLDDELIDLILDYDIRKHRKELVEKAQWILELDEVRQYVLLDMAFNLGVSGLLKFENTLGLVRKGDYEAASYAMLMSKWARQVGTRAKRLAKMMRTGQWPE